MAEVLQAPPMRTRSIADLSKLRGLRCLGNTLGAVRPKKYHLILEHWAERSIDAKNGA